ncbi:MAG: type II toxin-antitoxin system YafQ family toxin, partial [Clostridia bacterium]|nr:type II toxin-antitoxin system YafQ family toxin [Clostridia bacterium]
KRQHRNTDALFEVIEQLAEGKALEGKYRDHRLSGNYAGTRECHIEPDWLLVYERNKDVLVLSLLRIGTHAELFNK